MHSYSFYCGHLSECHKRLRALDENNTKVEPAEDADLRETLAFEVTSPSGRVTYPKNLTLYNFVDYLFCPTLCYELSYPRTDRFVADLVDGIWRANLQNSIHWGKLAEKAAAVFGCIFLLTVTSEEFILPIVGSHPCPLVSFC